MNSNEVKRFVKLIKLNKTQREIIVGLLLGDGHLETQNNGKTFHLKVEHSINQKVYVDWLYVKLRNLVLTSPQSKKQIIEGKKYEKYWFNTVSLPSFRFYGQQFYPKEEKVIPKIISRPVTPLSLAIWFMDDGSRKSNVHRALILNTQGFDQASIDVIQDVLLKKFNIATTLRKQKEGNQIYIPATQVEKFISLIKSHIISSMKYKLS